MKTLCPATRIAIAFGLSTLVLSLAAPTARAGLFHRRTVVVETPAVYVAPVPTVYAAPVSTVVTAPAAAVVPTTVVEPVVPVNYVVPTVSTPVTTTYIPTVSTVPSVVVPTRRVRVVYPRRIYLYGY
jgi:hypothetical protein